MIVNIGPTVTIERHFTLSWFRLTIDGKLGCTAISDDEARQLLAYLKSELEPDEYGTEEATDEELLASDQCTDEFPCHHCLECDKVEGPILFWDR
jgi:hypothetical protein